MVENNYCRFFMMVIIGYTFSSVSNAATAPPIDKDKPVTIEANTAQLDDKSGLSIYSGNVTITQGSLHITADKVTAYHKKEGISKIVADGNPARYEQAAESKDGIVNASANTINYLTDENKIVLTGDATLEQQGNTVQGQNITYDMKRKIGNAGSSVKTSSEENGRVKMVFQPKSTSTPKQPTDVKAP
jgi:lipopolysaccharide export system protein LptA